MQAPLDEVLAAQQEMPPAKMTVPQLKEQLKTFNMPVSGKKADLVHRLETALAAAAATGHASGGVAPDAAVPSTSTAACDDETQGTPAVVTTALDLQVKVAGLRDHSEASAASEVSGGRRLDGGGQSQVGPSQEAIQKAVGGVQPGIQDLGDVVTFEVCLPIHET